MNRRRFIAGAAAGYAALAYPWTAAATVASGSCLWGAWVGSQLTGAESPGDMHAQDLFEQESGKTASIIHWSPGPITSVPFPAKLVQAVDARGSIPMITCNSMPAGSTTVKLRDIANGSYDAQITAWANAAAAYGKPLLLRHNQEMNSNWAAWCERYTWKDKNGVVHKPNAAGDFVADWRHVHGIVSAAAPNVRMVWCANADPYATAQPLAQVWPGDAYVEWVGMDGYNFGAKRSAGWRTFDQVYRRTFDQVRALSAKPFAICEVGCTESGGSKPTWLRDMLTTQLTGHYSAVSALVYFDRVGDGIDWPVETTLASKQAWHDGIVAGPYAPAGTALGA